jgi:hypothetical protein
MIAEFCDTSLLTLLKGKPTRVVNRVITPNLMLSERREATGGVLLKTIVAWLTSRQRVNGMLTGQK